MDSDLTALNRISPAGGFKNSGSTLSWNDTTAPSGLAYSYAIVAVDAAGNRGSISRGEHAGDTINTMP